MHFPTFQDIYSGGCTVAAQMLRLLHQHEVWDDQHLTCCLEANFANFVLGNFPNVIITQKFEGCTAPRSVVALGATALHRFDEGGVQGMHLLQIEY
jgi:hypothetical protein